MGFFDDHPEHVGGGGKFVTGDEKAAIAEGSIPFTITSVSYQPESQYGARYVLQVVLPDPATGEDEERQLSFSAGSVDSRDRALETMIRYLDNHDDSGEVTLTKVGRSYLIVPLAAVEEEPAPTPAPRTRSRRS